MTDDDQLELNMARSILRGVVKEMAEHGFHNSAIYAALADTTAAVLISVPDMKQRVVLVQMFIDLVLNNHEKPTNGKVH